MEKELAKISKVSFGFGGYDDAMFGATFEFTGPVASCGDFWGTWSWDPDESHKWTKDEQSEVFADTVRKLRDVMIDAKVSDISKLIGKPVELTIENFRLKNWRILTEVI